MKKLTKKERNELYWNCFIDSLYDKSIFLCLLFVNNTYHGYLTDSSENWCKLLPEFELFAPERPAPYIWWKDIDYDENIEYWDNVRRTALLFMYEMSK